jgi:hypothetical protein
MAECGPVGAHDCRDAQEQVGRFARSAHPRCCADNRQPTTGNQTGDPHPAFGHLLPLDAGEGPRLGDSRGALTDHAALTTGNRQPATRRRTGNQTGDPHPAFGHLLPLDAGEGPRLGDSRGALTDHAALTTGNRQPATKPGPSSGLRPPSPARRGRRPSIRRFARSAHPRCCADNRQPTTGNQNGNLLRERLFDLCSGCEIHQRMDQHARATLQVRNRDLLVHVVTRIRLARKPHPERDRVRQSLRVGSSA